MRAARPASPTPAIWRTTTRAVSRAALALCLAAVVAAPVAARADDPERAADLIVRVGRLHVGDGTVLRGAVIVIDEGRFVSVAEDGTVPPGVPVRVFADAVACPGFVDAVTQIGLDGGAAESPEARTPDVRAADAFDVHHRDLRPVLAAGVTTIGLLPAPSNVAAGRAAVATLRADGSAAVIERVGAPVFALRPPALRADRVPNTIAGARALLEAAFEGRAWTTSGEGAVAVRRAALDALAGMRDGPALAYVSDVEEARVAVETLGGRGLSPTLVGLRAAWKDPAAVAALGAPCVVTDLSLNDSEALLSLPAELARRGVGVSLASGAPGRSLRMALALAVAHGLPAKDAVPAVTHRPAAVLDVADRVGRVAPSLRADLLVFSGEPWEPSSRVLLSVVGGEITEERP